MKVSISATDGLAHRARLSHTELEALRHMMEEETGPAELARTLHVTSAAATGIVDRLEARGHVARRPHPSDRRRTQLEVTDSGRGEVMGLLAPLPSSTKRWMTSSLRLASSVIAPSVGITAPMGGPKPVWALALATVNSAGAVPVAYLLVGRKH